jgi:hypothetical protein
MLNKTGYISIDEIVNQGFGSTHGFSFLGIRTNNPVDELYIYWLKVFLSEIENFLGVEVADKEITVTKLKSLQTTYHSIYWNKKIFGIIPPSTCWLSSTGRFAAVDIHQFTNNQSYILWDMLLNKVMPLHFQNLEGIDEKMELVYCRTTSDYNEKGVPDAPMKINTEICWDKQGWDNSMTPEEFSPLSEMDKHLVLYLWDYDDKFGTNFSNQKKPNELFNYLTEA